MAIKNKSILLRLSERDLKIIENNVKKTELNRSAFIRKMATQGSITIKNFDEVNELVFEVNKIGNNINQIAKKANQFDYLSQDDIHFIRKKINDIYHAIERFFDE